VSQENDYLMRDEADHRYDCPKCGESHEGECGDDFESLLIAAVNLAGNAKVRRIS
jgi:hypothetical protein